jgi:putative ABC transport system permease protein
MTLTTLALRNALFRNSTRSILTVLGTMATALAFIFLRTVLAAWYSSSEASSADRVVTRNAISLTQPLPLAYVEKVRQLPGVTAVTWSNWFGGIYKDRKNFFAQFAIDPATGIDVFELRFLQGSKADFVADRNGCLVGVKLAEKYGFKMGDIIPLEGDIYPGEWRFKVDGIIEADDASVSNVLYFQWARLNEGLPDRRKDTIGMITTKVAKADDSPKVIKGIDDLFANSDNETHTETEKSFRLSFVQNSSALLGALQAVSLVILIIMALILGNTLAMGLRERTAEMGAMRAIGFLPRHVAMLSISEGAILGALGGILGVIVARPLLTGFGKIMTNLGFLAGVGFKLDTALLTVATALLIGALASAIPAWSASKMGVVDALRRQE